MLNTVTKLEFNLSEQLNLYKYIERLTLEKKDVIIKGDADKLLEIDRMIEAVICQTLELEQDRFKFLGNSINKQSKLSDFTKTLDENIAQPIDVLRNEIISVIKSIHKTNKLNIYLIKNSIKWIEYSVNTIANVLSPESSAYNSRGRAPAYSNQNHNTSSIIEHSV